jgi:uncharacterized protein YjlB
MDMTDRYHRYTRDVATSKQKRRARHGAVAARNTELLAIGASPPRAKFDLRRSKAEHARALASIPKMPLPASDPVFGPKGPLVAMWRT